MALLIPEVDARRSGVCGLILYSAQTTPLLLALYPEVTYQALCEYVLSALTARNLMSVIVANKANSGLT